MFGSGWKLAWTFFCFNYAIPSSNSYDFFEFMLSPYSIYLYMYYLIFQSSTLSKYNLSGACSYNLASLFEL
ncbi:hypothetical protein Tsubulata_033154 [Turnera subulata]|uniref:Uncharacterized protein n=1 Tax=Turnera subulata TaxID=218843 RepID=A0A9Q0G090_9ROSI|nr:hypothetical protein Tsubulata_033154 [Turnera subulata]